jgi:hypothetical protein
MDSIALGLRGDLGHFLVAGLHRALMPLLEFGQLGLSPSSAIVAVPGTSWVCSFFPSLPVMASVLATRSVPTTIPS